MTIGSDNKADAPLLQPGLTTPTPSEGLTTEVGEWGPSWLARTAWWRVTATVATKYAVQVRAVSAGFNDAQLTIWTTEGVQVAESYDWGDVEGEEVLLLAEFFLAAGQTVYVQVGADSAWSGPAVVFNTTLGLSPVETISVPYIGSTWDTTPELAAMTAAGGLRDNDDATRALFTSTSSGEPWTSDATIGLDPTAFGPDTIEVEINLRGRLVAGVGELALDFQHREPGGSTNDWYSYVLAFPTATTFADLQILLSRAGSSHPHTMSYSPTHADPFGALVTRMAVLTGSSELHLATTQHPSDFYISEVDVVARRAGAISFEPPPPPPEPVIEYVDDGVRRHFW